MQRHDRRLGDGLEEVGVAASEHACVAHRQRKRPGQRTEAERDHEEQRPDQVGNRAQEPCDAPRREAQQREWSSLAAIHEWTAPPQARGGEDSQAEPENDRERRTSDGDGERTYRRGRRDAEEARRKIRGKEPANERSDGPQVRRIEERRRRHPGPHPAEDERGADRAAEGHALHPAPPYSSSRRTEVTSDAGRSKRTLPPRSPTMRGKRSSASATSWSSATNVRPSQMRNNRSASWAVRPGSSEANGSSASTTCGSCTSTRANATRCCCPPDSSSTRAAARSARPTVARAESAAPTSSSGGATRARTDRARDQLAIRPQSAFCSAVSGGTSEGFWKTVPIPRRRRRRSPPRSPEESRPSMCTVPALGRSVAFRMRRSVDLPAPDAPRIAIRSPRRMCKLTSCSACTRPVRLGYTRPTRCSSKLISRGLPRARPRAARRNRRLEPERICWRKAPRESRGAADLPDRARGKSRAPRRPSAHRGLCVPPTRSRRKAGSSRRPALSPDRSCPARSSAGTPLRRGHPRRPSRSPRPARSRHGRPYRWPSRSPPGPCRCGA